MLIPVASLQRRLLAQGYAIGAADNVFGARTMAGLLAHVAMRPMRDMQPIADAMVKHIDRFGLRDTPDRLANWIGQTCHETGNYRWLREIWGPTDAQRRYEGRRDLGNTQPGDGKRFMGRGLIQVTGRANYTEMAMRSGLPLVEQPELLEQPDAAVLVSAIWWTKAKLNALVDAGREDDVTRKINGGENGISDRRARVARAKAMLA